MQPSSFLIRFGICAATCLMFAQTAQAQERTFSKRFDATRNGDIRLLGNTIMTCDESQPTNCLAARDGLGATAENNNNAQYMTFIDVDANSATFNSSESMLSLPVGSTVLWAGLYWGADMRAGTAGTGPAAAAPDDKDKVKLFVPGANGYKDLVASGCDSFTLASGATTEYQCFVDVTNDIPADFNGTYRLANVQAGQGRSRYAGWSLVVVFADPGQPVRNLVVFDGYKRISSSNSTDVITVSGFLAPPAGPVQARIGVVGYEGDFNSTGDSMKLDNAAISNTLNPTSNVFNSTLSYLDQHVTTNNPSYINQLGFDVDVIDTSNVIPNSATSSDITLKTGGETYIPGVVTFATEIYAPRLEAIKTVLDVNGGDIQPGDTLRYTLAVENGGFDPATNTVLTDTLPANVTYVQNTLKVDNVLVTEADDADTAELIAGDLVVRLGAGATDAAGGTLVTMSTSTIVFDVVVNANVQSGDAIRNQALMRYESATLGEAFESLSDADAAQAGRTETVVFVDQNPPAVEVTTPATGAVIGDVRPTISGTAEPGSMLSVGLSDGQATVIVVMANGMWSWQPANDLAAGAYVVTATATDGVGNSATDTSDFTVDLTGPTLTITQPADGSTTNETTPMITGKTDPGASVSVIIDGGAAQTVTADANGDWTVTPASALADGLHTIEATSADAVGNSSMASSTFTVDTSAPTLTIDSPANGSSTPEKRPEISGTAEAGAPVTVTIDGGAAQTVTADANGMWSLTPDSDLSEGEHAVVATSTDGVGNNANTSSTFTVDTTAPAVSIVSPAEGAAVETATPTISGTADAGSDVTVTVDGMEVGTVRANEQGQWVLTLADALENGAHTAKAEARDAAGNTASDDVSFTVEVGTGNFVSIAQPIDNATLNSNSPAEISGTATPGVTVTISIDGEVRGTAVADAAGNWTFNPGVLLDGPHTIEASVPDASDSVMVTVDRTGPAVTITSPTTGDSVANPPTVSGTTEPNATVEVFIDGESVGQTTADASGKWTLTPSAPVDVTESGESVISAVSRDANGNAGEANVTVNLGAAGNLVVTGGPDGCNCSEVPTRSGSPLWLLAVVGLCFGWRRRRRA